jgi:thiol-disulfide isomerase/thioredoxin
VWATWCGPCIDELPGLANIAKEYESKGVNVLGIMLDGIDEKGKPDQSAIDAAKKILSEAKVKFPSFIPQAEMADTMNKIDAIPVTYIVGPDGKLVDTIIGGLNYDEWKEVIDKALSKK